MDERDEIEPALDLPTHGAGEDEALCLGDDEEGMMGSEDKPGSSDDKVMVDIVTYDEPPGDVRLSPLPAHDDGSFVSSSESLGTGVRAMASFSLTADVRDLEPQTGRFARKSNGVYFALIKSRSYLSYSSARVYVSFFRLFLLMI